MSTEEQPQIGSVEAARTPVPGIFATFAQLPAQTIVDEQALAAMLSVSKRTIKRWCARGELPAPGRIGSKNIWIAGRILQFIEARIASAQLERDRRLGIVQRGQTP